MLQAMLRLSLSGLLALAAGGAHAQVNASFRDWTVVCDNTRVCAAFGFSTSPSAGYLKIERSPGPGSRLQAGLVVNLDEGATAPTRWALKLDGKPLPGFGALKSQSGDWGQVIGLEDEQSRQLVEAIRDAASLTLTASKTEPVEISLSGSSGGS
jgi:hypothetical protein